MAKNPRVVKKPQLTSQQTIDMARVAKIGEQLRNLREELASIFPERESLTHQIVYALLTRQHVLLYGPPGTGKSDLLFTLFKSIIGAETLSIAFTKFMSETNVIGLPDVRKMHKEGLVHYRRDGSILDAHFLELDEFLDANGPLLRTLLGILNERTFKRGRQIESANLHTAVASTNGDPVEEAKKYPPLAAVFDRFLFQCKIDYLKNTESRLAMYQKYLGGEKPSTIISLEDLQYISGIVLSAGQITDPDFIFAYEKVIEQYCGKFKDIVVSDRRKCKMLEIVEAHALLNGRFEVIPEDILAVQWGICLGNDDNKRKAFEDLAKPVVEELAKNKGQNVDEVQVQLLTQLEGKIPQIPQMCSKDQLVTFARELVSLKDEVEKVKPQIKQTTDKKRDILAEIGKRFDSVQQRILRGTD